MTIEVGEPIDRVTASAVLRNDNSFSMGGSIYYSSCNKATFAQQVIINPMLIGNVHFVAGRPETLDNVLQLLQKEGVETSGNPDICIRRFGNFGIDEARELSGKASLRPVRGDRRYFLIVVDAMTTEAQNALLKTLEEPPADAVFFFIHPAPQTLLATVRSRAQMIDLGENHQGDASLDVKKFLKARPAERLDMLKPILEKGDETEEKPSGYGAGKRDLGAIISFLSSLERELSTIPEKGHAGSSLHAVYRARRYIGDRGALVKPLLEQVALLV